jgi:cobalt-zinc-cadmium efflux system outer membrane protein
LEDLVSLEPLETLTEKLANNPRLTRFGAEKMQREARLRLEKAKAVPDVTVFGGAREFGTADDTALIVGASIPLPFFNRNQGAIRAARERLDRNESEKAAVQIELSTLLAEAYQIAQGATAQINLFRNSVLPQSEQALSTAREGYTAGRFSFLDVLDAQRTVIAARQQYIQALATYQQSAARVISLTVGAPTEPLPTR